MSLYCKIRKKLNDFLLDIEFEAGDETVALMGASGCGKSMTLKCIAGIVTPDSGRIVLNGKVLFDSERKINLSAQQRHTGMLFQDYALFPNMTVLENICLGISKGRKNCGRTKAEIKKTAEQFVASYHLDGLETHYPSQLSGGQKQRCALARMMASDPEIIMLDEPFSALDSFLRWQLEQEVAAAISSFGGTVLLVSHNRDEVFRLCNRVAVISHGKNEPPHEKHELYNTPQTYADALLTGCKNIYPALASAGSVNVPALGISIESSKSTTEISYVGIRARRLLPGFEIDDPNNYICIKYTVLNVTESVFSYILMIKPENGEAAIRWEISKETYGQLSKHEPIIAIHKDEIMLLRK